MNFIPLAKVFENVWSRFNQYAHGIHTEKWQGVNISDKPEAQMVEILYESFKTQVYTENLDIIRQAVQPNLPWADRHFEEERVSRQPINPGDTWRIWPWSVSADKHRTEGNQYNHSYAERYWPKFANETSGGVLTDSFEEVEPRMGIRYFYGDLDDVVLLLKREPLTRQAVLPVYFPEDTGSVHGGRVPCSIAYHFMVRGKALHCTYWLRSCDLYRHFRDDVYLTIRLMLWILDELRILDPDYWDYIEPGFLIMHIDSLHMFVNDYRAMTNGQDPS